jgi:hypothetical protein
MAEDSDSGAVFVRITNREIWEAVEALKTTVTSMDGRMNAILNEHVEIKSRIRALELKTYTVMAAFGTALLVAAGAIAKGVLG